MTTNIIEQVKPEVLELADKLFTDFGNTLREASIELPQSVKDAMYTQVIFYSRQFISSVMSKISSEDLTKLDLTAIPETRDFKYTDLIVSGNQAFYGLELRIMNAFDHYVDVLSNQVVGTQEYNGALLVLSFLRSLHWVLSDNKPFNATGAKPKLDKLKSEIVARSGDILLDEYKSLMSIVTEIEKVKIE